METVLVFLGGFLIGILTIGSLTIRSISVYDGEVSKALVTTSIVSVAYWFGVKFVVTDNIVGYIGFAFGEAFIIALLSYRQKLKKLEKKEDS